MKQFPLVAVFFAKALGSKLTRNLDVARYLLAITSILLTNEFAIAESTARKFSPKYYGHQLCNRPDFTCQVVKSGQTWSSLFQNHNTRNTVRKFNRINLALADRPFIVVPNNLDSVSYASLSPMPEYFDTKGEKLILVNLRKQAFSAYDKHGKKLRWGPISGGKPYCADLDRSCLTKIGSYRIYVKRGEKCASRKYGSPMPYCMFFKDGYAIHGADLPGHHDSHGCVRVFVDDAKWLNREFAKIGTRIKIVSGE